jgi:2-hydroxy-3-keto-5-methylthiopentenyl-1-phosphate phosphatase
MQYIENNKIILCDFDGTITKEDVNDTVFDVFGDASNKQIEKQYMNNQISEKEALKKHYANLNLKKETFLGYILNNIKFDSYFPCFLQLINNKKINFAVVSGGFINYIRPLFDKNNIKINFKIHANRLNFDNKKITTSFLHNVKSCHQKFGICGNCKYKIVQDYKNRFDKVIYIGDGLTDRCVADLADVLYVKSKSSLEKYCRENNIKYTSFASFRDIYQMFEEEKKDALSWG